jgi:hypothetical protein
MLKACGLHDLIAKDETQFKGLIGDMIRFAHVRDGFADQLKAVYLDPCIYHTKGATEFKDWIDHVTREAV